MAPRRCSVKECPSVSGQQRGIGFHTFPNNPIYRQIWMTNCGLPDTKPITKIMLICSLHFRSTDFLPPLKTKKYVLKQAAVPTIFSWGTLPYVEPKPHMTNYGLMNFVDDNPAEINQHFFDETVKIKSELNPAIGVKRSKNVDVDEPGTSEPEKKSLRLSLNCKQLKNESSDVTLTTSSIFDQFLPGSRIEVQDFQEVYHYAKVMEVDMEEKEILVYFEKNIKSKSAPAVPEWISMNSSRLRPMQTLRETFATYAPGDKCLARWTDTRKYPATVQKVLENNSYEVLFDDGFSKVVRARNMSKAKIRKTKKSQSSSILCQPYPHLPIPKFDLSNLNLLPVPKDGEWCCNWVNEIPIGTEAYLSGTNGYQKQTILVEDWRLPEGWTKHLYLRSSVHGKWDVVLVGPTKKRFRCKNDVKVYLEEKGEVYNPDVYDFRVHKKRAKEIGLYAFTEDYKEKLKNKPKQLLPAPSNPEFVYVGALKVELIDNLYHCPEETCSKHFRKENHLQIHVKHCHQDLAKLLGVCPNMSDLAYQRTVAQPTDEPIPKNQTENFKLFEEVYLPDLISTAQSTSPSTPVKVEQNSSSFDEEVNILSLPTGDIKIELSEEYELTIDSSIEPTHQLHDFIGHSMTSLAEFSTFSI